MKNIALIFTFLMLIGCGPSHEEYIKMIEDDYSVLDNDTLKVENDLLTQMVAEEERLLNITNAANIAIGVLSFVATGSGGFNINGNDKYLESEKQKLEAITNLLKTRETVESKPVQKPQKTKLT